MTLDDLKDYLNSDANEHGLDSMATHGFLTATVIGKPLPNWLSLLFEGEENQVDDAVKEAVIAWREAIFEELQSEEGIELPFDIDEDSGDVDFSPESELSAWSVGFIDAMYGDETIDWMSDDDIAEDVAMLTLPMMIFSGIDTIDPEEGEDEYLAEMRADDDAMAQMANSIENNLNELFLLFHTDE